MNKGQFKEAFENTLTLLYKTMDVKNTDYATKDNPFSNFTLVNSLWITTVERWILVRMTDKLSRISNLIDSEAKVKDETIIDTLVDLANYSIILKLYIEDKNSVDSSCTLPDSENI